MPFTNQGTGTAWITSAAAKISAVARSSRTPLPTLTALPYAAASCSVTVWPRRSSWATRRLVVLAGSRRAK